jgi:ABC-type nitrate/sulfonate/bicarbonate transport system substrate-binding protein
VRDMKVKDSPATLARFAVAQRSTAECLGLFAQAQGLFLDSGVDFRLVAFETAAERGMRGLLAGEWDYIEIGITPLVRLKADGHDPVIVVGTTPVNTNFLMGRRDIAKLADLAGGRIGCLSLGGQTAAAARAVLAPHGIADAVKLVPLTTYSKIFDAVAAGEIEGAILAGDIRFPGEVRHGMRVLADIGAATRLPGTCVVTTRREIERNPDLARRIVRTYVGAVQTFKTRPEAAKVFLADLLRFDAGTIERIYAYYRSVFQTVPRPSLPHIQIGIDEVAREHPMAARVIPADLVDLRFLDEFESAAHRVE